MDICECGAAAWPRSRINHVFMVRPWRVIKIGRMVFACFDNFSFWGPRLTWALGQCNTSSRGWWTWWEEHWWWRPLSQERLRVRVRTPLSCSTALQTLHVTTTNHKSPTTLLDMHHLSCGISSLLHSVNLILFTVLLLHLILCISPYHSP